MITASTMTRLSSVADGGEEAGTKVSMRPDEQAADDRPGDRIEPAQCGRGEAVEEDGCP